MTNPLPPEIEAAIDNALEESYAAEKKGDLLAAAGWMEKAWELIPLPKEEYDYAQILGLVGTRFFRNAKMLDKAHEWLARLAKAYGDGGAATQDTLDLLEATIRYEEGDFDRAFLLFHKHFKVWKNRTFENEDPKYKKFYHAEAARRK